MPSPNPKSDKKYTYKDYLTWSDDERWEIIDGVAYNMSPAPNTNHQRISMNFSGVLYNYLKGKNCQTFAAPFDGRFTNEVEDIEGKIDIVVQPDLAVICDKKKIDEAGCKGAPDLIIEILSPSTSYKDEGSKLKLYEKHGVKEYWVVNPDGHYVMVYTHDGKEFAKPDYYKKDEILESRLFTDMKVDLKEVFEIGD
jgi:Uma2 family endonuclease